MGVKEFKDVFDRREQIVKDMKASGKTVMQYACIFVPEEMFHAAGVKLVRIFGDHFETPVGDSYVQSNMCTYLRSCMQKLMTGQWDHLDGFVTSNSCDHQRRFFDNWKYYKEGKTPFLHQIVYPHIKDQMALDFLKNEFQKVKKHVEEFTKVKLTNEALEASIRVYNKTRRLLRELYDLRKAESPVISASDVLDVLLAGLILPKEQYNDMLEKLLAELKVAEPKDDVSDQPRVLLMGGELDDSDYIRMIEGLGANIVADDMCIGSRYFWSTVDENTGDPINALTRRYLRGQSCPRMTGDDWDQLHQATNMAKEFHCNAMIMVQLKFCDMNGCCYPMIKTELSSKMDIPSLFIDREYIPSALGQVRTRVQAFFESLE